jgi:hypothetical protein
MRITGIIRTHHQDPACVSAAVAADNLREMETRTEEAEKPGLVTTTVTGERIRSIIASVDDYLANITVAEELCKSLNAGSRETGSGGKQSNPNTLE